MRLFDFDFRELDRKWISVSKWKDIKRIGKKYRLELEDALVLIYLYIDHEKGICGYLLGNLFLDPDNTLHIDSKYMEHMIILEDDILSKIKFNIIENGLLNNLIEKEKIEKQINLAYYQDENVLNTRSLEILDEFRHTTSPDDLELLLNTNNKEEFLWGKVQIYSKDRLICRLLTDSKYDSTYVSGTLVLANYVQNKKDTTIVIQYPVSKKG